MMAIIGWIFYQAGMFSPAPPAIRKGEIDLSGTWKIWFSDNAKFADPKLDDSHWCWIGVPNPQIDLSGQANDKPAASCPQEKYPKEKMLNNVYWYRKKVEIKAGQKWEEPSLFLGAIKQKAWVYWDGQYLGPAHLYLMPVTITLNSLQVQPGTHMLAVKVKSEFNQFPGIFHAFSRKIAIGELKNSLLAQNQHIQTRYILPAIAAVVQISALVMIMLLTLMMSKQKIIQYKYFWLILYFGSTSIFALDWMFDRRFYEFLQNISFVGLGVGVWGYGIEDTKILKFDKSFLRQVLCIYATFIIGIFTYNFIFNQINPQMIWTLKVGLVVMPYFYYVVIAGFALVMSKEIKMKENSTEKLILLALLVIHANATIETIFLKDVPIVSNSPIVTILLTLVVISLALIEYTDKNRSLAFYGRFIRPGLKKLLEENKRQDLSESKLFRAKQTAILKIDIVNHTKNTFRMPYGMKRLYQDLWFTMVDEVLADKVFLDKNLGDGSIYCFDENLKGGTCRQALDAAFYIRDIILPKFDAEYRKRLKEFIALTPEVKKAADEFIMKQPDFWSGSTKIRMALVCGYVDEGLWGLSNKSHYDVQGDLVTYVARVESQAEANEILLSEEFCSQLNQEQSNWKEVYSLSSRECQLKGIGTKVVFSINKKADHLLAA